LGIFGEIGRMKMDTSEEFGWISKANKIRLILMGIFTIFFLILFILQLFLDVYFILAVIMSIIMTTCIVLVFVILRKYFRR